MGGAESDSARQPTSARRMKANSTKGPMIGLSSSAELMPRRPASVRVPVIGRGNARPARPGLDEAAAAGPDCRARARSAVGPQAIGSPGQQQRAREMCSAPGRDRAGPRSPSGLRACQPETSVRRSSVVRPSTAAKGSSSRIRRASCTMVRAKSARCIWPPDKRADRPRLEAGQRDPGRARARSAASSSRPARRQGPRRRQAPVATKSMDADREARIDLGPLRQVGDVRHRPAAAIDRAAEDVGAPDDARSAASTCRPRSGRRSGQQVAIRDAPVEVLHGRPAARARVAERHAMERERRHAIAQAMASQSRPDRIAAAASLSARPDRPTIRDRGRERG